MADAAVGIERTRLEHEMDRARERAKVAEAIAGAARHILELCKTLTLHSHERQQIRDAAELTIEATGLCRSAEQVKAAAAGRVSALEDRRG